MPMLSDQSAQDRFRQMYEGIPPWDIDRPQPAFIEVADKVHGNVLDVGCGTGELALYFAERGRNVTGVDFLAVAIERARQKSAQRQRKVDFRVLDALQLSDLKCTFDTVLDSGLFHVLPVSPRRQYVEQLRKVTALDSRLLLLCFSEHEPGTHGPFRISQPQIREAFKQGWQVESITATRFETHPDSDGQGFSPGGPKAWFAVIRRL